jgi:nucleoside 2-deoxyribosyltransferase
MRYYLAGPMTGLPEYNFPTFERVATLLRKEGLDIASPHEIDHNETPETRGSLPYWVYLKAAFKLMLECDGIILLPGFRSSKGAREELYVADRTGMCIQIFDDANNRVIHMDEWKCKHASR